MELILARSAGAEVGVLPWDADFETGGENNFEIMIPRYAWNGAAGFDDRIYVPWTEYGGIVGEIQTETEPKAVYLRGTTWRGMIKSKIVEPTAGQAYYYAGGGTVAASIRQLLADCFVDPIIRADPEETEMVRQIRLPRYCTLLDGINRMLAQIGKKIKIRYEQTAAGGEIVVGSSRIVKYDNDLDTGHELETRSNVRRNGVNHLICLGQGNLQNRTVVHIYTDAAGKIVPRQVLTGRYEIAEVYDYPAAESASELREAGTEYLADLKSGTEIEVKTENLYKDLEIGDQLRKTDPVTKASEWREIDRKILRIIGGVPSVEIKLEGEE